jgi:hypothetical protein
MRPGIRYDERQAAAPADAARWETRDGTPRGRESQEEREDATRL